MKVKSEKLKVKSGLEDSVIKFHNKATDEKISITIKETEDDKLDINVEFDPALGNDNHKGIVSGSAMAILNMLKNN